MYLIIDGLDMPEDALLEAYTSSEEQQQKHGIKQIEKGLVSLGDAPWNEDAKAEIVADLKRYGFSKPLRQKLVEPYAIIFGGRDNEGEYDFSKVNWELLVDYFKWESASIFNRRHAYTLQDEAKKKYGGIFNHKGVYFKERQ